MNWMIKVTIGMLLMTVLFVLLGMAVMRANEYRPAVTHIDINEKSKLIAPTKDENIEAKKMK
jgi:hypothetical protein